MKSRRRRNSSSERSASRSEVRKISAQGGAFASPLEPSRAWPPEIHGPAAPATLTSPWVSPRGELLQGLGRGLADLGGGVRGLQVHQRPQGLAEAAVAQDVGRLPPDGGPVVGEGGAQDPTPGAR